MNTLKNSVKKSKFEEEWVEEDDVAPGWKKYNVRGGEEDAVLVRKKKNEKKYT